MVLSMQNNNPGNMVSGSGDFQQYDSPDAGLAAMQHDLLLKISGNSNAMKSNFGDGYTPTLANVISTWAPPNKNDTANYIGFVSKASGIDPNKPLTPADVNRILPAMIKMEGGKSASSYFGTGTQYAQNTNIANDTTASKRPSLDEIFGAKSGTSARPSLNEIFGKSSQAAPAPEQPSLVATALEGAATPFAPIVKNTLENLKDAATQTGEAISEPASGQNVPYGLQTADMAVRGIGKVGNVIGGTGQALFSPVTGAATAAVEPFIPAVSEAIKSNLVPNDPRFQALKPGDQVHQVARGIGNDVGTAVGLGMAANQGAANVHAQQGLPPVARPNDPLQPVYDKIQQRLNAPVENKAGLLASESSDPLAARAATIDEIKSGAKTYYKSSEAKGGMLNATGVDKAIAEAHAQAGLQSEEGKAFAGENAVTKTLDDLKNLQGKSLSLKGAGEIDDDIGDRIGAAFRSGNNEQAVKLMKIRDTLRNAYKSAAPEDMVNPEGFADWRTGDTLWTAYRSAKDVQDIIDNAELADVPSTAIKNGFKTFIKNERNLAPFNPAERALLKKAAETGIVTGALKAVGNKIITGVAGGTAGFAGGGIPGALAGAAAGQAAGYPFRVAATALQRGKAENVINSIGLRPEVQNALDELNKPL